MFRIQTAFLILAALLVGCAEDTGVDFCKNHYAFHADHLDQVATLTINIAASGELDASLVVPTIALGSLSLADARYLLEDPARNFSLDTESPCEVLKAQVSTTSNDLLAEFEANCGTDNKLGRVTVLLFEHFDALEEVVVSVTTDATSKRFAINRRCDSPIFRLDPVAE